MARARELFTRLGMARTELRNGVLVYLGVPAQSFAVLGDRGIHEKVSAEFWPELALAMADHFHEDRFADGIAEAVLRIGGELARHFPRLSPDTNELRDEISYSP
jgi:uncharacterized membrane protein